MLIIAYFINQVKRMFKIAVNFQTGVIDAKFGMTQERLVSNINTKFQFKSIKKPEMILKLRTPVQLLVSAYNYIENIISFYSPISAASITCFYKYLTLI